MTDKPQIGYNSYIVCHVQKQWTFTQSVTIIPSSTANIKKRPEHLLEQRTPSACSTEESRRFSLPGIAKCLAPILWIYKMTDNPVPPTLADEEFIPK